MFRGADGKGFSVKEWEVIEVGFEEGFWCD